MTEYAEGQAPPNYAPAVSRIQRKNTKIGQNPNIRPMVHNNVPVQGQNQSANVGNSGINSGNNDDVVFYGQSGGQQGKIGGQNNRNSNYNNNSNQIANDQIGVALQVQTQKRQRNNTSNNNNNDNDNKECLTNPRQLGALSFLGVACFISAIFLFQINQLIGWLVLCIGFIAWICVGIGLSKLQSKDDGTPTWIIVCCPCICVLCFLCGAAGDGTSLNMFEKKKKQQKPPAGKVIVSR